MLETVDSWVPESKDDCNAAEIPCCTDDMIAARNDSNGSVGVDDTGATVEGVIEVVLEELDRETSSSGEALPFPFPVLSAIRNSESYPA